ncbi:ADP-ribosylation factor-like protein 3 [Styela clava]
MSSNRTKVLIAMGAVGVGVTLAAGYLYSILQRKKRDEADEGIGDEDSIISDSDEPPVVLQNLTTPVTIAPKEQNVNEFEFPPHDVEDISEEDEEDESDSQKKVLILGLDGAGKTALIETLTKHQNRNPKKYTPTNGFNVAQSKHGDFYLNLMEVGGGESSRPYWPNFLQKTDLLVFVVDGSDQSRLTEAKDALFEILKSEELREIPCLLLANKQDLNAAVSCDDVISAEDLASMSTNRHLKFTLLDCVCIPDNGETDYAETIKEVITTLLQ